MTMNNSSGSNNLELSPLVGDHLTAMEDLCEREAWPVRAPLGIGPMRMPGNRKHGMWEESGVEDESDSNDEVCQKS